MGALFFHADGQTDMTKVMVGFHNFGNAPKNGLENRRDLCTIRRRAVGIQIARKGD
jgi:hypothetical protein